MQYKKDNFCIYKTEFLIRFLASFKFVTPTTLGILFFFLVSCTLTGWAYLAGRNIENTTSYVTYFENISWSISLLYLFPFVFGLTLKFYQAIPELFEYLYNNMVEQADAAEVDSFRTWLDRKFNGIVHPFVFIVITLALNFIYFKQILENEKPSWMVGGVFLNTLFKTDQGLTIVGLYAAIIQLVLVYWIFMLIWKTVIFSWGLHEFFNKRFTVNINPLHPDGSCGLKALSSTAMYLNYILLLLGFYVSLKVIDKIMIQHITLFGDIGNPMMLGGYAILAPLIFFYPLGAPHYKMKEAKQKFIRTVTKKSKEFYCKFTTCEDEKDCLGALKAFQDLEQTRNYLMTSIPVWPFNFKSIEAFMGVVLVPLLPTVISLVVNFLIE